MKIELIYDNSILKSHSVQLFTDKFNKVNTILKIIENTQMDL
jgi:hypothetical protein